MRFVSKTPLGERLSRALRLLLAASVIFLTACASPSAREFQEGLAATTSQRAAAFRESGFRVSGISPRKGTFAASPGPTASALPRSTRTSSAQLPIEFSSFDVISPRSSSVNSYVTAYYRDH
jgi:hypothetical protein